MTYRNDALHSLERAKTELAAGDSDRLKYAALELRMAMESLTYDRALAYKKEFPESEYETWQPKKVMQVLLEIDPHADAGCTFSMGREPSFGEMPTEMHCLGTETVLNMATIKSHYDALGSYLHVLTIKRVKAGKSVDCARARERCEEIVEAIEKVLASRIWNITMGQFASFDCECGSRIRRRLPPGGEPTTAECECGAKYDVEQEDEGKFRASLEESEALCVDAACRTPTWVPNHLIKPGTWWKCSGCGAHLKIQLGLVVEAPRGATAGA